MMRDALKLENDTVVFFDRGKFDDWCVYVQEEGNNKWAPRDPEYFAYFQEVASRYGKEKVYDDFVQIYSAVGDSVDSKTTNLILEISNSYEEQDRLLVQLNFSVMYFGMIAERNKRYAVLKERIKRLGFHQVIVEGMEPAVAANFSRGKKAKELIEIF